jgi:alcohol dehydrogenase YqhD (iron-dependent ADH family)
MLTIWKTTSISIDQDYFRQGTHSLAGEQVLAFGGKKVLLHYGGGSIKRTGIYVTVVRRSQRREFRSSNSPVSCRIRASTGSGRNRARQTTRDRTSSGDRRRSVIDSAKAIAFGSLLAPERTFGRLFHGPDATIPAQCPWCRTDDSCRRLESSNSCVITNEDTASARSENRALPSKFSILDPEVSYSLPPFQTACGAIDSMRTVRTLFSASSTRCHGPVVEGAMRSVIDLAPGFSRILATTDIGLR